MCGKLLVKPTTACVAVCEVIEQLRTTCWPSPPNSRPKPVGGAGGSRGSEVGTAMEVAAIPVSSVAMKACFRNRTMIIPFASGPIGTPILPEKPLLKKGNVASDFSV